ncbi:MAG: ribonuclease HII [Candidatus Obscuribacterales bacterium]|nr:ribonuclease HII [Candidatus Obscuribacterales bacterium]
MPQAPVAAAKKKILLAQLEDLLDFDHGHRKSGRSAKAKCHIVGTDEVGRGCLAGPVVASAVVLPEITMKSNVAKALMELNDSKKLTLEQRERLSITLKDICHFAIGEASVREINEINILNASLLAMKRAIDQLVGTGHYSALPVLVLIDGNKKVANIDHIQQTVIGGDSKSASIAAASIIAKVHRDRLMTELSEQYPAFGWHQNKGYGSKLHRDALQEHGMTEWHRHLFCQKILCTQLSLTDLLDEAKLELDDDFLED